MHNFHRTLHLPVSAPPSPGPTLPAQDRYHRVLGQFVRWDKCQRANGTYNLVAAYKMYCAAVELRENIDCEIALRDVDELTPVKSVFTGRALIQLAFRMHEHQEVQHGN